MKACPAGVGQLPLPGPAFSHPRPFESLGALGAHMFVEPRAKRFDKGFAFARGNEAEIHARELVSARSCTRIGCLERSLAQNPQILRITAAGQVAMLCPSHLDRMVVESGKNVSVRVDIGGCRFS